VPGVPRTPPARVNLADLTTHPADRGGPLSAHWAPPVAAIGATPAAVRRIVVTEGVLVTVLSIATAIVLAVPLTVGFDSFLGGLAFRLPLPFAFGLPAVLLWSAAALTGAVAATATAARRAARLTIREALAHV
jgi:putative ABC transport system permease protein